MSANIEFTVAYTVEYSDGTIKEESLEIPSDAPYLCYYKGYQVEWELSRACQEQFNIGVMQDIYETVKAKDPEFKWVDIPGLERFTQEELLGFFKCHKFLNTLPEDEYQRLMGMINDLIDREDKTR